MNGDGPTTATEPTFAEAREARSIVALSRLLPDVPMPDLMGYTQADRIEAKLDALLPMIGPLEEFAEMTAALKGNPMVRGMLRTKGLKLPRE